MLASTFIGWDVGDKASLSPKGRQVLDIGSGPNALQTARGEGVAWGVGEPNSEHTKECGVGKSSVSWSSQLA